MRDRPLQLQVFPDGQKVAVISDGGLQLFELASGQLLGHWRGDAEPSAFDISADQERILVADVSGAVAQPMGCASGPKATTAW